MSRIRSRGNKETELALIHIFRAHRIKGWRRHVLLKVDSGSLMVDGGKGKARGYARPTGARGATRPTNPKSEIRNPQFKARPDFVFHRQKVAVMVDGCFWHCCPKHSNLPVDNRAFWSLKLARNRARDRLVDRSLRRAGWRVLRIWEHELRNPSAVLRKLRNYF
jgi:DNA mismatch endonuclease (patch repair protein)